MESPRRLYIILLLLVVAALVGISMIYRYQSPTGRTTLLIETAKGLIQIVGIVIIGALVKFLFDDYQDRRRRAEEALDRERQRRETLNEFRADKIRRLVLVTNTLRRAPILRA